MSPVKHASASASHAGRSSAWHSSLCVHERSRARSCARRWAAEHSRAPALLLPPITMDPGAVPVPPSKALVVAGSDSLEGLGDAFEWALQKMAKPGGWGRGAGASACKQAGTAGSSAARLERARRVLRGPRGTWTPSAARSTPAAAQTDASVQRLCLCPTQATRSMCCMPSSWRARKTVWRLASASSRPCLDGSSAAAQRRRRRSTWCATSCRGRQVGAGRQGTAWGRRRSAVQTAWGLRWSAVQGPRARPSTLTCGRRRPASCSP